MTTNTAKRSLLVLALFVLATTGVAQEKPTVEQLQKQLEALRGAFEREQAAHREQLELLRKQIESLKPGTSSQLSGVVAPPTNGGATNAASTATAVATAPQKTAPPAANTEPAQPATDLTRPIQIGGNGKSYVGLSLDGLFAAGASTASNIESLQPGGHDPKQRGFTVQGLEMVLDGAVDPFFRGQANLLFQTDARGESRFELEEGYLVSTSLPANLQLKAGQYYTEFGRLNPTHPHAWTFVDQPLVNGRFLGPDGLRNPGARLSWLLPTPFYSELYLGIQNSQGETAASFRDDRGGDLLFGRPVAQGGVAGVGSMLFAPRYAASFDLSDTQTLLMGTSAAFGPNGSGTHTDTQIYGVDWFWKWKSPHHDGGFPFVSWQTEGMLRNYDAGSYNGLRDPANPTVALPAETLLDYGFYSQVAWGFRKGWVTALRGDYVAGNTAALTPDPDRLSRWRVSPNLTWYPSEYSKIRVQYNYDQRDTIGPDHSLWLQMEFLLGSHAAHQF